MPYEKRIPVRRMLFLCLVVFLGVGITFAAELVDQDLTISHLNAIINWYRDCSTKVQSIGLPSDQVYQETSQNLAQQAVRLAFQSGKASAQLVDASVNQASSAAAATSGAPHSNFEAMLSKRNT